MGLFRTGFERTISVQANIILMLRANSNKPVTHWPIDAISLCLQKSPARSIWFILKSFIVAKVVKSDQNWSQRDLNKSEILFKIFSYFLTIFLLLLPTRYHQRSRIIVDCSTTVLQPLALPFMVKWAEKPILQSLFRLLRAAINNPNVKVNKRIKPGLCCCTLVI